jgi:Secretion system C-terminal sorting domain
MKKILLSFGAIGCALLANAQVLLNEVYVRPNPNALHQEYFELMNTNGLPENADCYTVVTYFETLKGGPNYEYGFYVIDIPDITMSAGGFLVGSSQAPDFYYQNGTATADFSWNAGNINRYVYINDVLTLDNTGAPFDNIFVKSNGRNGNAGAIYAVFLFKNGMLADALLGRSHNNVVPSYITSLGTLTHESGCGSLSFNFENINYTAPGLINNVIPEAGTDNGYYRLGNGCASVGDWKQSTSPGEHTPGTANPGQNTGASDLLEAVMTCVDNLTVQYNITAGHNSAFPVIVNLYWDANGSQFLDSGDVFLSSQVDDELGDTAKTFAHLLNQEDVIFVFDASGRCYDTMIPLNCPANIVLPVTWKFFQATRENDQVVLKWTTATEINNRGFNVERLQGNGTWQSIAFIESKAGGGNSTIDLSYTYIDNNQFRGISRYRLQQVDNDGRFKYSAERTVSGTDRKENGGVVIYPNPSNGSSTIVFQNLSTGYDVYITDMGGRTVKQFRGVVSDNLKIDNLTPGMYVVRIIDQRSGMQINERLVVNSR